MSNTIQWILIGFTVVLFGVILFLSPTVFYNPGNIINTYVSLLEGQELNIEAIDVNPDVSQPNKIIIRVKGATTGKELDLSLVDVSTLIPTTIVDSSGRPQLKPDGTFAGALGVCRATLSPNTCLLVRSYRDGHLGAYRYVPVPGRNEPKS